MRIHVIYQFEHRKQFERFRLDQILKKHLLNLFLECKLRVQIFQDNDRAEDSLEYQHDVVDQMGNVTVLNDDFDFPENVVNYLIIMINKITIKLEIYLLFSTSSF